MKKITLATVKSFVRKNNGNLFISTRSSFDGMTDCVQSCSDRTFKPAAAPQYSHPETMGIEGAWFVGGSRDYFTAYDDGQFQGFEVTNCCGRFILAVQYIRVIKAA